MDIDDKRELLERANRILVGVHTIDAMVKDGKIWHAGNKTGGVIEQITYLIEKIATIPETTPLLN